jgi:hypothetical protein
MSKILPPFALVLLLGSTATSRDEVDFQRDIRPILSDRCFACHGPDAEARKADLRLDVKEAAFREAASDLMIVKPDKPNESELYLRITNQDEDLRMPPAEAKRSLSEPEIELIRKWIEQGASWKEHWSFIPVEAVAVPDVEAKDWPVNSVDRFILAKLDRDGLRPSEIADRERLIRRLTFDLTGLPPTLAEIDSFLADESPGAYEKVVDRLLKSPRYGERMAANWLDVARYSDTFGYQVDRDRFVWPWRDWVIRAFNNNMPYDEFIRQQLAGDLLPNATDDQILATTFNRLHPQKVEGGSTPEEFRIEYVADRNQTFATALLGLTMECCRCHDHKYDPISQREYYQLTAFFDNIDEFGLYSYFTPSVPTPTLLMTDDLTKGKIADIQKRIAAEEQKLTQLAESRREVFGKWYAELKLLIENADIAWKDAAKLPGLIKHLTFEDYSGPNQSVPGRVGKAVRLTGDDGIGLDVGNFKRFEPFSVALWMKTPDVKERAVVFHRSRAWTDAGSRGYQLLLEDGRLSASLIHFWPGNAIRVRTKEPIAIDKWLHVAVTYDGSSRADGLSIFVNGKQAESDIVRDNLYKNITGGGGDNITIGERFRDRGFSGGLVDEFQVFNRELTPIEVAQLHDRNSLTAALIASSELTAAQQDALYRYYLANVDPEYKRQLGAVRSAREERSKAVDGLQEIMVMRELPHPRQTYLLKRGAYDKRGEPVDPETPAVFPPLANDAPRNRLGLAQWLTDPQHPLTARVAVNRLWQMCFGVGLVRTPEDFGRQGEAPTHPQLLDWLAHDFMQHDWDTKRTLKMLVMSATYRQSSSPSVEQLARDPDNRLLSRAPSYRLPAEMLRDNALAASGLLVEKLGGAPARPYEVEVSFKPSKRDQGDGLHRRSVYTYWKRTGPAPAMMTLDASKRDVCRVRRERTSSPLQAFVLLNGPQFVEASRMLAQRLIQQQGENTEAVLNDMFRLLTSRRPSDAERGVLLELYQQQLAYFEQHPDRAEEFLKTGDKPRDEGIPAARLAAAGLVANTLLNFDESVMKR